MEQVDLYLRYFAMKKRLPSPSYESMRIRALELRASGKERKEIMEILGIGKSTLSRWLNRYDESDTNWYKSKKAGTKGNPKLKASDLEELVKELNKGCAAHGFEGEVWTRKRVGAVIAKKFGVQYDPAHVGRLLKKAKWSRQKPMVEAMQQSAERVEKWYKEDIERIKKKGG